MSADLALLLFDPGINALGEKPPCPCDFEPREFATRHQPIDHLFVDVQIPGHISDRLGRARHGHLQMRKLPYRGKIW